MPQSPVSAQSGGARRFSAQLTTPINYLKGVGPRRAEVLRKLGIRIAGDLLWHVPHRYEDATTISPIGQLAPGGQGTVIGTVISTGVLPTRKGLRIFQAVIRDDSGMIELAWPGQPFLDRVISKGDVLLVTGPVRFFHGRQLVPREFVNLGPDDSGTDEGRVIAVYPATEGFSSKQIRALVDQNLENLLPQVEEYLTTEVLEWAGVPRLRDALRMVHRPSSVAEALRGRARLAFEELFFVHLLQHRARMLARERRVGINFRSARGLPTRLKDSLPFALTAAQKRALREIVRDMCGPTRMHRLLQGDVGSGKTIVAFFAAMVALQNGYQAALMAPTELLAEQHFATASRLLEPLGVAVELITGGRPARERDAAGNRLASGEPLLAIGTHALVQNSTRFGRLGLAIVDEQHRFGVEQRAALGQKNTRPDVLLMSATPIPRSLALTLYGDLDLSVLQERPPGRKPVTTRMAPDSSRERVMDFVAREVGRGRQAYIVYPIIDDSERGELRAATTMFESLANGQLAGRRVALLHGRMSAADRDSIMRRFRDGKLDVLVATTVIEVGIDVPNATVMLIEHPERFGLAQLHQLRGRVGRGADASYCILLGDSGDETKERLSLFVGTEDGFEIARADLRLRGMGDLFGERQHGIPMFRYADPLRDEELAERARAAAATVLAADPALSRPEHSGMRLVLTERYARALDLFRVG
jgi:ATP-dependent DNA helicase RecG